MAFVKEGELLVFYGLCTFITHHYFDMLHLIEDNDGERILVLSENFLVMPTILEYIFNL